MKREDSEKLTVESETSKLQNLLPFLSAGECLKWKEGMIIYRIRTIRTGACKWIGIEIIEYVC